MYDVNESWTQVTTGAVSEATVQHLGGGDVVLAATDGSTPAAEADVFQVNPGEQHLALPVAEVWPGKTSATLWAKTGGSLGARLNVIGG